MRPPFAGQQYGVVASCWHSSIVSKGAGSHAGIGVRNRILSNSRLSFAGQVGCVSKSSMANNAAVRLQKMRNQALTALHS